MSESLQFISEFKLRGSWGRLGGALGSTLGNYDYVILTIYLLHL